MQEQTQEQQPLTKQIFEVMLERHSQSGIHVKFKDDKGEVKERYLLSEWPIPSFITAENMIDYRILTPAEVVKIKSIVTPKKPKSKYARFK